MYIKFSIGPGISQLLRKSDYETQENLLKKIMLNDSIYYHIFIVTNYIYDDGTYSNSE